MSPPTLSVVVPAFNAEQTIGRCVTALTAQDIGRPYEIIVVDDGSADSTADIAGRAGAKVISTQRGRPAAARNAGIRAASGDIVCCTDADCEPLPDWLRHISAPFDDATVAACKGVYRTRQRSLVARFVQLEYEDKYDLMRPQGQIDFIDTYSAAYRRDVVLAAGSFDPRFEYLEDQELSFRLAGQGHKMVYQEKAVVYHQHTDRLGAYFRKKFTIGYWKAQVVRRFPSKRVRDSHTPQVMKVQMALMALIVTSLFLGLLAALLVRWRGGEPPWAAALPFVVLCAVFLLTTVPFLHKAWRRDRPVMAVAPALLGVRALALGLGYAWGLARPRQLPDAEVAGRAAGGAPTQ